MSLEWQCLGQAEPTGQFGRREAARQLQEGERVPTGFGHELVGDALIQPPGHDRREELSCVGISQSLDHQPRQGGKLTDRLADGEDHDYRLRQQPPRHERQRLRGGAVQPLRVVDHAQKRALLSRRGQQAEHRQADEQSVRRGALAQPERDFQRAALRRRKSLTAIEQRRAQLMQRRECQLHLRLQPRRTYDEHVRGRSDRIVEQRRLPDSRLPPYYEHTAAPSPCSLTQPIEDRAFVSPTA